MKRTPKNLVVFSFIKLFSGGFGIFVSIETILTGEMHTSFTPIEFEVEPERCMNLAG